MHRGGRHLFMVKRKTINVYECERGKGILIIRELLLYWLWQKQIKNL